MNTKARAVPAIVFRHRHVANRKYWCNKYRITNEDLVKALFCTQFGSETIVKRCNHLLWKHLADLSKDAPQTMAYCVCVELANECELEWNPPKPEELKEWNDVLTNGVTSSDMLEAMVSECVPSDGVQTERCQMKYKLITDLDLHGSLPYKMPNEKFDTWCFDAEHELWNTVASIYENIHSCEYQTADTTHAPYKPYIESQMLAIQEDCDRGSEFYSNAQKISRLVLRTADDIHVVSVHQCGDKLAVTVNLGFISIKSERVPLEEELTEEEYAEQAFIHSQNMKDGFDKEQRCGLQQAVKSVRQMC